MCRILVTACLVLAMVSVSFADVIIGNWETPDTNEGYSQIYGAVFVPHVTAGHTLGGYAGSLTPASSAYTWSLVGSTGVSGTLLTVADWMANNRLSFDVTRLTSEWTTAGSSQYSRMHVAMNTNLVNWTTITPSAGVVLWTGGDNNAMTATVDYSAYLASQGGTPSYLQIIFATQAGGWNTTGKYYIDNVRLFYVPPPNPPLATNPDPCDRESPVDANTILSWQVLTGYNPTGYNIYLDTNESAVRNATPASSGLFHKDLNQTETRSVPPSDLNDNTTYWWRVDALVDGNTRTGVVWKFKTKAYITGDIDKDGWVSFNDMDLLAEQWLEEGAGWPADIDKNLKVDFTDYAKMATQWHRIIAEDLFGDSGSLCNWTVVDEGGTDGPSNWQVASGEMVQLSNIYGPDSLNVDNRRGTYACWKYPESLFWADYKFDVSLRSADDDGIGVIFRYQNPNNYYKFDMDSQRSFRKLFKMYNGTETTLATSSVGYTQGQQMQLSVDVNGNKINILLDGNNVFGSAITDSNIGCGTVALYDWGNAGSYFDNFKVNVTRLKAVTARDDSYNVFENKTLNVSSSNGLLSNDVSRGGSLTANLISSPQHGELTEFNPDGTFIYTPDANYSGQDSFTYEAVVAGQDAEQATATITVHSGSEFTIVVLPDTQYTSASFPDVFNSQTQWIVDNKDNLNIVFVLQEGDLTNNNGSTTEWSNASAAMGILDGNVPYAASVGNHDLGESGGSGSRDTLFNDYFPESRFSNLVDIYETNHAENSYHYLTVGGTDWLVFALEFGPRTKILDWVNSVIAANPHRRVIIVTHNYMYSDDTRVGTGDSWNPHEYGLCSGVTGGEVCNDGEEMWTNCVKLHQSMSFVFSGHICNDGLGKLVSVGDNGNNVYQMLANYQNEAHGGNGWLRIITFYPEEQKVAVKTYSPYLSQYRTDADNQFEFTDVNLATP